VAPRRAALIEELYHEAPAARLACARPLQLIRETTMAEAMIFDAIRTRAAAANPAARSTTSSREPARRRVERLAGRHDLDTSQVDDVVIAASRP